jgi:ABC-type transport system involved in multi-copper enzyme maturation permease subunit
MTNYMPLLPSFICSLKLKFFTAILNNFFIWLNFIIYHVVITLVKNLLSMTLDLLIPQHYFGNLFMAAANYY